MRNSPTISVIVPTYNRYSILKRCLSALFNQTLSRSKYEVIVIDDGSFDETSRLKEDGLLTYLRQSNKGPAAARNRGIKKARGEIVLIIGDDIIATPDLLEKHIEAHNLHPEKEAAILGYTTWSRDIRITPFMEWLEKGGPQFAYHEIEGKNGVTYRYFYTSNISLKRDFLLENGLFDEEFPYAAYEDVELGWRLMNKGLKIFYYEGIVVYHEHYITLEDMCRRMERCGESFSLIKKKVSSIRTRLEFPISHRIIWNIAMNPIIYMIFKDIAKRLESRFIIPPLYWLLMGHHFQRGYFIKEGKR